MKITASQIGLLSNNIDGLYIHDINLDNFQNRSQNGLLLAHIYWNISYRFIESKNQLPKVIAQPIISKKSWMNFQSASKRLLQHQYGHYLIGCWCALDFQQTVNINSRFLQKGTTKLQYYQWCAQIFKQKLTKYCEIEKQYDRQTCHYCDQEKQAEWQQNIAQNINFYYQTFLLRNLQKQELNRKRQVKLGNKQNVANKRPISSKKKQDLNKRKQNNFKLPKISMIVNQ